MKSITFFRQIKFFGIGMPILYSILFCLAFPVHAVNDAVNSEGEASYPTPVADDPFASYHPEYAYYDKKYHLTDAQRRGRDNWYLWTGGNEKLWRKMAKISQKAFGFKIDLLQLLDTTQLPRDQRWEKLGAIIDPLCQPAEKPDEYGLWMDKCESEGAPNIPSEPSGIVGVRKFKNPNFDPAKWDVKKYWDDASIEPPYIVGLSCGVCHIAFDPQNPPKDPKKPKWKNLVGTIGNQYLEEGRLFSTDLKPNNFLWHVANTQQPGTSDTSRIATDHINNPNAINTIFGLAYRPSFKEIVPPEVAKLVGWKPGVPLHHILKDGSDSIGNAGATLRVYVNIGMCSDYWLTLFDPIYGRKPQKPFEVTKVTDPKSEYYCEGWVETAKRVPDTEQFLLSVRSPAYLKDAGNGEGSQYITKDKKVLERGKIVFADNCAKCHSSKRPPQKLTGEARQAWFRKSVLSDDFLVDNYLSDDARHPITETQTNAARALATNAIKGHIWDNFSSQTYKNLPSPGSIEVVSPFIPTKKRTFEIPDGGRGYYRTPTLINIWATAPLFHNNSLGIYNKDPSIRGRVLAFEDAIKKLLWPELREFKIKRTSVDSYLQIPPSLEDNAPQGFFARLWDFIKGLFISSKIPEEGILIPAGTPVNLIANVNFQKVSVRNVVTGVRSLLKGEAPGNIITNYDFVENKGHYFGAHLLDEDKRALIEFLKTF